MNLCATVATARCIQLGKVSAAQRNVGQNGQNGFFWSFACRRAKTAVPLMPT